MEMLRSGKFKPTSLGDVLGRAKEFAFDYEGQKVLASLMEKEVQSSPAGGLDMIRAVFDELFKDGGALAMAFEAVGSVFLERALDGMSREEQAFPRTLSVTVAKSFAGSVLKLALHTLGCRVLQKTLDALPDVSSRILLVEELRGAPLSTCVESCHGNYVVQKIVTSTKGPGAAMVVASLGATEESIRWLATHNFGCRVVQRILEVSPDDVKGPLLDSLVKMAPVLICDTYG